MTNCKWKPFEWDNYETSCGNDFTFNDGTPEENDFRFCPYCGLPVESVPGDVEFKEEESTHGRNCNCEECDYQRCEHDDRVRDDQRNGD